MMCVASMTKNDVVLWRICYNSRSQGVNSHARIKAYRYPIKKFGINEVMLWLTQMMCYKVYIGKTNDVEENLDPTIFDFIDSIVIFLELEHA